MTPDQQILFTYAMIFLIIILPIAALIIGGILKDRNKKTAKWFLIAGGSIFGLYGLFFIVSLVANFFNLG